jgi:hypothetical protein
VERIMEELVKLVEQKCEECGLIDVNVKAYKEKNIVCVEIEKYGILCFKENKVKTNYFICEYFIPMYVDHIYNEDVEFLNYFIAKNFFIKEIFAQTEVKN